MSNLALKVNKKLKINQNTISKISRIGVNFLTSQPHQRPEGHVIIFFSIEKQGLESKVLPAAAAPAIAPPIAPNIAPAPTRPEELSFHCW